MQLFLAKLRANRAHHVLLSQRAKQLL